MGWFGNRDNEFLDEDELRLRRESAKRNKKAHADCQANHSDDSRFDMSRFNIKPHEDCEADHSDDFSSIGESVSENINKAVTAMTKSITSNDYGTTKTTTYKAGSNGPTFRSTSYTPNGNKVLGENKNLNPHRNTETNDLKIVVTVITGVMLAFAFMMMIAIFNNTTAEGRKAVSVQHNQREVSPTTMNVYQREIIMSILAGTDPTAETVDGTDTAETTRFTGVIILVTDEEIEEILDGQHLSEEEVGAILEENGHTTSEILTGLLRYSLNNPSTFDENALALLQETDECAQMSEDELVSFLEEHGFTEANITYAVSAYTSEADANEVDISEADTTETDTTEE